MPSIFDFQITKFCFLPHLIILIDPSHPLFIHHLYHTYLPYHNAPGLLIALSPPYLSRPTKPLHVGHVLFRLSQVVTHSQNQ